MIRTPLPRLLVLQFALLAVAACSLDEEPDRTARETRRTIPAAATRPAATPAVPAEPVALAPPPVDTQPEAGSVEATLPTVEEPLPADVLEAGRRAWAAADYPRAANLLEAAAERGEASTYDRYLLGLAYWKAGRLEDAETTLVDVAWAADGFVRAPLNLARVRLDRGDVDGAAEAVDRALAIDPESPDALNVLGRVRLARGDHDGAAEAFRRAMELDRDDPWPANNLGFLLLVGGDATGAVEALEQAVTADPGLAIAWHNLALARERTGAIAGAAEAARQAAALDDDARFETTLARLEALVPSGGTTVLVHADDDSDASAEVIASAETGSPPR